MKKIILVGILAFAAGILFSNTILPYIHTHDININADTLISNKLPDVKSIIRDKFIYDTTFDGEKFNTGHIDVPYGDYFTLTNKSADTQMSILSNVPQLNTPRPYGEEEKLQLRFDIKGNFYVEEKNTHSRMTITVK